MSKNPFAEIGITEVLDILVFIFEQGSHNSFVPCVMLISNRYHFRQLLLLYLHNSNNLSQKCPKAYHCVLICLHVVCILFFIDFEGDSILFKNLVWSLSYHWPKNLFYIHLFSCKYSKLFGVDKVIKMSKFSEEPLEQGPSLFNEFSFFISN